MSTQRTTTVRGSARPKPKKKIPTTAQLKQRVAELEQQLATQAQMEEATAEQAMALLYSEMRFRTILSTIGEGLITVDKAGKIVDFSSGATRLTGLKDDDMKGQSVRRILPQRLRSQYDDFLQPVDAAEDWGFFGTSGQEVREMPIMGADGAELWVSIGCSEVEFNNEHMHLLVVRDITERHNHLQSMKAKNRLVKLLREGAIIANESISFEEAARKAVEELCEYAGWSVGHVWLYDRMWDSLYSSDIWYIADHVDQEKLLASSNDFHPTIGRDWVGTCFGYDQIVGPELTTQVPCTRHQQLQEQGLVAAYAFPISSEGQVVAVLECFHYHPDDINQEFNEVVQELGQQIGRVYERDLVASHLREQKEQAEAANVAKSEFLANMSHELRTPMNAVLGLLEVLLGTALTNDQLVFGQRIQKSAINLLDILNDILDLSKIEANELELDPHPMQPNQLIEDMYQLFQPVAANKKIGFVVEQGVDENIWLHADSHRMRQVMVNLIGNAVKFTESGEVTLSCAYEPALQAGDVGKACFIVRDTGIGIPEDRVDAIFDKFTQVDNSTTRKYGGTGLGLAITKHLVDMMGGVLNVESSIGEGTTFYVTLPLKEVCTLEIPQQSQQKPVSTAKLAAAEAQVLLVEDDKLNQEVALHMLRQLGMQHITVCDDGAQALQQIKSAPFDIVFMDCQMPVMDGYTATQELRKLERDANRDRLPVIAMTANAMVGDREKCLQAGMDEYISKPVRPERLKEVASKFIKTSTPVEDEKVVELKQPEKTPVMDHEHLASFTGGDKAMESELAELFLQQSEGLVPDLQKACETEDNELWRKRTHRLKGSAGNLGATALHTICRDAEQAHAAPLAEKQAMLSQIQEDYAALKEYLAEYYQLS